MDFIDILNSSGMKMTEFSEYFGIPYRTVQDWKAGKRKCPEYLLDLMNYKLKKEKIIKIKEEEHMFNTIRLLRGSRNITVKGDEMPEIGCAIYEDGTDPEELNRWVIEDKEDALKELTKYRCSYQKGSGVVFAEEYALEFFEADEDGDFVQGSDFDFAEIEE